MTRDSICSRRNLIVVIVDTLTGVVYGEAHAIVEQEINTVNNSVEYTEYMNIQLLDSPLAAGITLKVDSTCSLDNSCKQDSSPWAEPRPIAVGGSLDGTWTRSWTGIQGYKEFRLSYDLNIHIPRSTGGNVSWGGDEEQADGLYWVRCDNKVSKLAGCIVPDFIPTLVVDKKKHPAARNFIARVQENMSTHPGWEGHGQPLHREEDAEEEKKNRKVICEDGSFKPNPDTPDASCDEYPFARAQESGRQFGVTSGAQCQQYWAEVKVIGGQKYWILFNEGTPPAEAKCGRASIPKDQNMGVGGALGRRTVEWRLLGGDPYWVDAGASDS
ncbi:hypothetical protein [Streptomyces sp. B15]|uniref:NucA/NucB deoxyribonuclease domain-containing protein n=1 Tax=Streptomyces sp. B15 TaxID=1537797 RepID=UPI001B3882C3|nr:hypothetical protein [Streptomyces sp. B15]MBQ1121884.1 hypothetical protein [Streptomyces sp. B15]